MAETKISAMTDGGAAVGTDRIEISRDAGGGAWDTFRLSLSALLTYVSLTLAPKNSPAFTGTPSAPTAAANVNNTQLATTAFVANFDLDLQAPTVVRDDFLLASTESGEIGDLGWSFTNGSWNLITPEANHPGIARRTSSAAAAAVASSYTGGGGTAVVIRWDQLDEQRWVVRPVTTDADYDVRIGFFSDATANPPANGVYIERLAGEANWYGVTRQGGVQTRSAALGAFAADWIKFKIRRIDASTVGFTVNSGTEVTQNTNVIGGTTVLAFGSLISPTAANAGSVDFDAFSMRLVAQTR